MFESRFNFGTIFPRIKFWKRSEMLQTHRLNKLLSDYHKCSIPLSLTRPIDETSHSRFSSDGTLEDLPLIARATTNGTWYRCFIRWLLSVFSLLAGRTGSRGTGIGPPIPYHFTTERTYARSVSPRRGPCCLSRHAPIGSRIFVH